MTEQAKRPNILIAILLLAAAIAGGAHLSAIPLFFVKVVVSVLLVAFYAFFGYRIVNAMQIGASGPRAFVGLVLAALTLYATWAIRIPAFSGWETAFTANPGAILDAIVDRAGSLRVTKAFGAGTSADGPSWLILGTYIVEALAFVGIMTLGAMLAGPAKPKQKDDAVEQEARQAA